MDSKMFYIAETKFGKGVFAARDIKKGEEIYIFAGKKVSSQQLNLEIERNRNILVDPFQIGIDTYILLDEVSIFFNHSCSPNAGFINGTHLTAIKNIKKNEEIFYDYSTTWYDGMECQCGSKNCRKHISDYFSIPPKIRKKYRKLGIVPQFIPEN